MMMALLSPVAWVARFPRSLWRSVAEQRKLRACVAGTRTHLLPSARIENHLPSRAAISIGQNTKVAGELLVYAHGGKIVVGDNCFIGEGSRIWSASTIQIGDRVLISHGVNIHDSNSHSISADRRHRHILQLYAAGHPPILDDVPSSAVTIEDDAWIGFNATILKGVTIGRGAVVGACSVVTADVPAFSVVVGNPAQLIGKSLP